MPKRKNKSVDIRAFRREANNMDKATARWNLYWMNLRNDNKGDRATECAILRERIAELMK